MSSFLDLSLPRLFYLMLSGIEVSEEVLTLHPHILCQCLSTSLDRTVGKVPIALLCPFTTIIFFISGDVLVTGLVTSVINLYL